MVYRRTQRLLTEDQLPRSRYPSAAALGACFGEVFEAYYDSRQAQVRVLGDRLQGSRVLDDLRAEVRIYREAFGEFGYEVFVLQHR